MSLSTLPQPEQRIRRMNDGVPGLHRDHALAAGQPDWPVRRVAEGGSKFLKAAVTEDALRETKKIQNLSDRSGTVMGPARCGVASRWRRTSPNYSVNHAGSLGGS